MPLIQQNHGDGFIENAKRGRRGTFTLLKTTCHGGGRDGERSSLLVKPMRTDKLYKGKNMGIAYITECNLMVVDLEDLAKHILVVIMSDIDFFSPPQPCP